VISSEDLERICRIGHDSSMRGQGLPLRQLLADTRYRELRGRIDHGILMQHLVERPDLAQQWLMYSEDKRTSGGWYLTTKGPEWEVGRLDAGKGPIDQRGYGSGVEACASYILLELDFWATLATDRSVS
jgi:hypothetical protein